MTCRFLESLPSSPKYLRNSHLNLSAAVTVVYGRVLGGGRLLHPRVGSHWTAKAQDGLKTAFQGFQRFHHSACSLSLIFVVSSNFSKLFRLIRDRNKNLIQLEHNSLNTHLNNTLQIYTCMCNCTCKYIDLKGLYLAKSAVRCIIMLPPQRKTTPKRYFDPFTHL